MSPTAATFVLEAVNFLLLAGTLGYFFFRPVRGALEERRAASEKRAAELSAKLAEAERLRDEAQKERGALEQEMQKRRSDALAEAERESRAMLADARDAARGEREAAKQALSRVSDAELLRLAGAVADAAGKSVERLLSTLDATALDRALVSAACRELRSTPAGPSGKIVVETARPLEAQSRGEVDDALGARVRDAEFRIVPAIGAGIRITTGHGLVDASIEGLADYARRILEKSLSEPEAS